MPFKKLMRKIKKAIPKELKKGPAAGILGGALAGKVLGKSTGALKMGAIAGGTAGIARKLFKKRREQPASVPAPEGNMAGMSGKASETAETPVFRRGGAVRKSMMSDMKGRAMKKTGSDAMGRAMAKKPAAKKMMGGGMARGYRSGGMAKKSSRGC
jgi:hypothetical protein